MLAENKILNGLSTVRATIENYLVNKDRKAMQKQK